jgi:hypothetical protein
MMMMRHVPEDCYLHIRRRENFKSYIVPVQCVGSTVKPRAMETTSTQCHRRADHSVHFKFFKMLQMTTKFIIFQVHFQEKFQY